ncbi:MAG: cysteine--tRNA ligase [Melioribacteraceae bacterium]|nr:cysteine--tRNA ligase [Melioribacteraceae bacterium]
MQIYNTLSGKKEEFEPLNPPDVTFYMCGPTVYDLFHIGNGRSFIMSDIFRRYLIYKNYNVKFAMNLTDIDDRIIQKSIDQKIGSDKVADEFTKAFFDDIKKLKVKEADIYPKATEHIQEIIELIKQLELKNLAYESNGDVFFDVSKFPGYGKLSGKKLDELESGARVEVNDAKRNPLDFALWKKAKAGEPFWESPWGNGRPGWHIECSAMSMKHLGESIDIHGGGNDLIFPHHENEIAQSEGASGKQFAKYWMHFGFLNINKEKMSKSLGNFFTAREILNRHSAEALRLLFLQTHYRGPLNYSEDLLESAARGAEKISNYYRLLKEKLSDSSEGKPFDIDLDAFKIKFEAAMDDDFNTPQAVAVLFDLIKSTNKQLTEENSLNQSSLNEVLGFMKASAIDVFGIISEQENQPVRSGLDDQLIRLLINVRTEAKLDKNYTLADKIRDGLTALGISLKDGKEGTTYNIN